MQRLLIHCQGTLEHGEQIKNFLETRLPYEVSISYDRDLTHEMLTQKSIQMLLFETNKFVEADLQLLKDSRSIGFTYPSLIVADKIEVPNFAAIADKMKSHILSKPFEFKALRGITQKLMLSRNVPQQMHKRFKTQQSLMLETYATGELHPSNMYNLSVGGAYCEFTEKPKVSVGELVRLRVNLNDVSKEHSLSARVVWTTRNGPNGGEFGVGLRFIKGQEIYKQILEKV